MRHHSEQLQVRTEGRGTVELTSQLRTVVEAAKVEDGLCNVFVHHTSASLTFCENADPAVRRDLEAYMGRLVPDGDPRYEHDAEGPDDMAAHIRSVLTLSSVTIPIHRGQLDLGTWQGLYVWEHRTHPHQRRVTVSILGTSE